MFFLQVERYLRIRQYISAPLKERKLADIFCCTLLIGEGKGGDALKKNRKRITRKFKQIKAVAIDMANSYSAWVAEVLPDADIVYDHFHVIKSMNDKLNPLLGSHPSEK